MMIPHLASYKVDFIRLGRSRQGTSLEDRPRYTSRTTFRTFAFPDGLTPNLLPARYRQPHADAIASAARRLFELRQAWLYPDGLMERVPEAVPGYPDRFVPATTKAAAEVRTR